MLKKIFFIFLDTILKISGLKPIFKILKKHYKQNKKVIFIIFSCFMLALAFLLGRYFNPSDLLVYKQKLISFYENNSFLASLYFFSIYLLMSLTGIPGAFAFLILAGFVFGFFKGFVISLSAHLLGSSIAFLIVRFFFRDFFISKSKQKIKNIYDRFKKDELYYLFAFRLFPFTPLFFTNIVMGLGDIKFFIFFLVCFITALPNFFIYLNAGSKLYQLEELEGLWDPSFILAFSLIAFFPILVKYGFRFFKKRNTNFSWELDEKKALIEES